jgi:hypothetical protein
MKPFFLFVLLAIAGCNNSNQHISDQAKTEIPNNDSTVLNEKPDSGDSKNLAKKKSEGASPKPYSNERFQNVTVRDLGNNEFLINGQAQVFEASFTWIVEDGHEEILQGHNTTDAGAPAWGNFSFTITALKKRPNSTLHLVLFEASAKDGSRQHQLSIPLY